MPGLPILIVGGAGNTGGRINPRPRLRGTRRVSRSTAFARGRSWRHMEA